MITRLMLSYHYFLHLVSSHFQSDRNGEAALILTPESISLLLLSEIPSTFETGDQVATSKCILRSVLE